MGYTVVKIQCEPVFVEIFVAECSAIGYDSFLELDNGLEAYIEQDDFDEPTISELVNRYPQAHASFRVEKLEDKNWNVEWEKNFEPIAVGEECIIRASFHEIDKPYCFDLVINPKMSFGTGHHATTYMMVEHLLEITKIPHRVLDVGCGTGVLAILAEKKGAGDLVAIDNNTWCIENSQENFQLNDAKSIALHLGTVDEVKLEGQFGLILANINRNVLLEEIPKYAPLLETGGSLMLSGFFEEHLEAIKEVAQSSGLSFVNTKRKNNWVSPVFIKN